MNPILDLRELTGMTQAQLAHRSGTSQPTIAAYESGSKSPTLRTVERLARAAGFELAVSFVPPLTREDRRSLVLHRHIARRLRAEPERVLGLARRNLLHMWRIQPGARPLLGEWRGILKRPIDDIVTVLRDPSQRARDLRQVTPFAGVLTPSERARVYRDFRTSEAA